MAVLLNSMEETGNVDLTIVPKIDETKQLLDSFKTEITNADSIDPQTNFLAYHIVRNIGLALDKMKSRFLAAQENHDNPIVAEDSLSLIPVMGESFQVAERIMGGELTQADAKMIFERVRVLRDSMYSGSMVITSEEETGYVPQSDLREQGRKLSSAIKDIYSQEQQDTSRD